MAAFDRTFSMTLGNDRTCVPSVVQTLLDECERRGLVSDDDRFRVAISLEEALVNAVVHGNLEVSSALRERGDDTYHQTITERRSLPKYRDRQVIISCRMTREHVEFEITDEGRGFDVAAIPDPTDPEHLERPCGRGLLLMRAFMDDVRYNACGNSVTLTKRISKLACSQEGVGLPETCSA